jgi:glycopeptide antibiotics resistance protein
MSPAFTVSSWVSPLPWLVPVCLLALVVSTLASGWVARALDIRRPVAWMMLLSLGVIIAATLTPLVADSRLDLIHPGSCDLSRMGPPAPNQFPWHGDVLGNILMFIPLGFAIAVVPRSRRKAALLVAAVALPIVIEATQLVVVPLGRACESGDVVDNLTGLFIGLAVGAVVSGLAPMIGRTAEPEA